MNDDKLTLSRNDFIAAVDALSSGKGAVDATHLADNGTQASLLGERIRMAREWKGFTIEEVALKTGLEKETLQMAEAGEVSLPLGSLIKVAKSLSLRLADVIARGREPFTVHRSGEGRSLHRFGGSTSGYGYSYESLAPNKKGKTMEPFLVTLYPQETLTPSSHEGQEFIFVLDGEIEVTLEGNKSILRKGDAIYYDSLDEHLVKAHGTELARIVAVFSV